MLKVCQFCKKEFNALRKTTKYCSKNCYSSDPNHPKNKINSDLREDRVCPICNKIFNVKKLKKNKLCSEECRKKWSFENKDKRINLSKIAIKKKYGVDSVFELDSIKEKIKNTNIEKYGVDNPAKSNEILEKIKNTNIEKYGFYSHLKNDDIKEKIKKTNVERYGSSSPLSSKKIRNLISTNKKNKNLEFFKNFYSSIGFEIIEYTSPQHKAKVKCLKCEKIFLTTRIGQNLIPNCNKCNSPKNDNKLTKIFEGFLNECDITTFVKNDKFLIHPKEVDYVFHDKKMCIEINGNYWHSELNGKDKNYHLNKTKNLFKKGYKLIHIFEDEFLLKTDIVKSRIFNFLNKNKKIYGRKCVIKEIDVKIKEKFLIENHIQGDCKDSIRIGLFYENELVSVMTFGKRKISKIKELDWELLRFSNKKYHSVVGGFSKLLNYFIKENCPKKIITYADIRWSGYDPTNTIYNKLGFDFIGYTPPNYWYTHVDNRNKRFHRYNFIKSKLIKEGFDKNLSEWDIMKLKGYDRIWDCGSMKFILFIKN